MKFLSYNSTEFTHQLDFELRQYLSVEIQGKLLTFTIKDNLPIKRTGETRSACGEFTESSRLRLLKFIARVKWSEIMQSTFITLTYPDEVATTTKKTRNKQRYLFWRKLEKHLGRQVPGLWRLEWKPRRSGARKGEYLPHFHLLCFGVRFVDQWLVRKWWRQILHTDGWVCTDVKAFKKGDHAAMYLAKYVTKIEEIRSLDYPSYLNIQGRAYGFLRKSQIPMEELIRVNDITEREKGFLMRAAAEKLPWIKPGETQSFTLLGDYAVQVAKNLLRLWVDKS